MTSDNELFDSSPYYVPPPPTRLKVTVDMWSKSATLTLRGTALELYNTWKETQHHEDETAFADWILEDVIQELEISVSDWEEV